MDSDRIRDHHLPQHIGLLPLRRPLLIALSRHAHRWCPHRDLGLYFPPLLPLHRHQHDRQNCRLPVIDRDIRYIDGVKPLRLCQHIVSDKRRSRKIRV